MKPATTSIEIGKTSQLTPTVAPADADDQTVTYESSDVKIATVDANGLVTGVAAGKADVTIKTNDGDFTAKTAATVTAPAGE